jgi:uncharacterized protein (DUF2336 family)
MNARRLNMPHRLESKSRAVIKRSSSASTSRGVPSTSYPTLIDELEAEIANRSIASRADVLRRVTDLFVTRADHFDDQQRALFDDVMGRLVDEIETSARAAFGERIAKIANAPPKVSRALALDDAIEVAGPLLTHAEQLDENTLIVGAKTKSQPHLFAISQRKSLSENITDVLVERGDQKVVVSTAANPGAQFSEFGYSTLVVRSEVDEELAQTVWARPEIPRVYLLTLFGTASETVRLKLEAADRGKAALVRDLVKQALDKIQTQTRERSPEFLAAHAMVKSLHQAGALTEYRLRKFAQAGMFDETAVAFSLLSDMPIGATERALVHERGDHVLLLAKSIGLSWDTTKAILLMKSTDYRKGRSTSEIEESFANFEKLKLETARTAIKFYRLKERAAKSSQV